MKKWAYIILAIAAVLLFVFKVVDWQTITMLAAAVTAPFRKLIGLFGGGSEEKIRKEHAAFREKEAQYQADFEKNVTDREQEVQRLEEKIKRLDEKLLELDEKRDRVSQEVEGMSLQEKQLAGQRLWGS